MPNPVQPNAEVDDLSDLLAELEGGTGDASGAAPAAPVVDERQMYLLEDAARKKMAVGDGDRDPSKVLSPEEMQALDAGNQRQAGLRQVEQTAADESAVPTAAKLPLMAIKGASAAISETAELAGINTGASKIADVGAGAGALTKSVTQFAVGMFGAGKVLKARQLLQGTGKVATVIRGGAKGAMGDFAVFDAQEERLSNLIEDHPWLANPITDYLAADEDDGQVEGRLKNVLEGGILGGAVEFLMALKSFKRVSKVRAAEGDEAAAKVAVEEADAAQAIDDLAEAQEGAAKVDGSAIPATKGTDPAQGTPKDSDGLEPQPKGLTDAEQKELDNLSNHYLDGSDFAAKTARYRELQAKAGVGPAKAKALDTASKAKAITKVLPYNGGMSPAPVKAKAAAKAAIPVVEKDLKDVILERTLADIDSGRPAGTGDNFNFGKIAAPDEVKNIIDYVGQAGAKAMDSAKGGVQTFEQTRAMADVLGQEPEELMAAVARMAKDAPNQAAILKAGMSRMVGLGSEIAAEARRLDSGVATSPARYEALIDELSAWEMNLKAVQTGAARTTSAGRMMNDPAVIRALIATGGDISQIAKIVRGPGALTKAMNVHNEFWINALLSGVKTQVVNGLSNTVHTLMRPAERALGGNVREGLSMYVGLASAVTDSIRMAWKSFKLEDSVLDVGNRTLETPRFAISNEGLGVKQGFDWLGKAVRIPTRFLTATDEFFKQINYRADLHVQASRSGMDMGLKGADLATHIHDTIAKSMDASGKGTDARALQYARETTFTNELGKFGKWVQSGASQHPSLRLVIPFIRTPTNIIKQTLKRTPLGMAHKSFWDDVAAGGTRRADALGKQAAGGLMLGGAVMAAHEGRLSGRGPSDRGELERLKESGWQPYSVKVGDKWISYNRIEPFGTLLGLVADYSECAGHVSDGQLDEMAGNLLTAVSNNLTSKTYLRGIADIAELLTHNEKEEEAMKRWERFVSNRTASYVGHPRQLASLMTGGMSDDPIIREVRGTMDAILNQIPGLSTSLPPKRGFDGKPAVYPIGYGPDSLSPIAVSTDIKDTVKDEIARLGKNYSLPGKGVGVSGKVDLTKYTKAGGQDAYDRYLELRSVHRVGRYLLAERLEHLIDSSAYKNATDDSDQYGGSRTAMIDKVLGQYREAYLQKLKEEYPTLKADLLTDWKNSKRAKSPKASGDIEAFVNTQK